MSMTEKRYDYSELKDGTYGIFKDKYYDDNDISFSMRLCEVTNEEQARTIVGQLNGLVDENEQLKQQNKQAIELILDGIMEMHDGKRDYAETIFNKAIKLLKSDVE